MDVSTTVCRGCLGRWGENSASDFCVRQNARFWVREIRVDRRRKSLEVGPLGNLGRRRQRSLRQSGVEVDYLEGSGGCEVRIERQRTNAPKGDEGPCFCGQ